MSLLVRSLRTGSSSPLSAASRSLSTTAPRLSVPAKKGDEAAVEPLKESVTVPAGVVSGAPDEIHRRPVRIYRPSAPSTQSAKANTHHWRLDWDILQGAGRWENPLMGWASSADYMQGTHVKFNTKEDAIHFCEKQGYPYYIQEPNKTRFHAKSYANNYLYSSKPLRIIVTK